MSSVIDSLPAELEAVFVEVVGAQNETLLQSLYNRQEPSRQERVEVTHILSDEFTRNLGPDDEPTARGRDIDNVLGAFLLRWPIEPE